MATVRFFGPYTFNLASSWSPGVEGVWWWKPPTGVDFTLGTATVSAHAPSGNRVTIALVETRSRINYYGSDRYLEFRLRNLGPDPLASFVAYISLVQA